MYKIVKYKTYYAISTWIDIKDGEIVATEKEFDKAVEVMKKLEKENE